MPYEIGWLIESRVITGRLYGDIIEPDGIALVNEMARLIDAGTPPVQVVIDILGMKSAPKTPLPLVKAVGEAGIDFARTGHLIIVSVNPLYSFMGAVAGKVFGSQLRILPNQSEAWEFIRAHDPTLWEALERLSVSGGEI